MRARVRCRRAGTVAGQDVFVEARGTDAGGIVLVQPQADALAVGDAAIRRTLLALVIALVPATALSLAVATRMARPLRRAARAAHQLADGRRDVAVLPEGPAEVAEVAEAVNSLAAALSLSEARQRELPAVRVARPPDAADGDQRVRRVPGRGGRGALGGRRGGCGPAGGGAPARAPRR